MRLLMNTLNSLNPCRKVKQLKKRCSLRTEHRKNMGRVVSDVSYHIETDFIGKKINAVPNEVLNIEFK